MTMTQEERAQHAAELLSDPIFCEIMESLKAKAIRQWAAAENPLDRDYCHASYNAVSNLTRDILREVETAATAEVRASAKGRFYNLYHALKEQFK